MLEPASGHEKVARKRARPFNSAIPVQYSVHRPRGMAARPPAPRPAIPLNIRWKMPNVTGRTDLSPSPWWMSPKP